MQNIHHIVCNIIANHSFLDVTSVCLIEGFQNQNFMLMADRILKEVGKDLAAERIKVSLFPIYVYTLDHDYFFPIRYI